MNDTTPIPHAMGLEKAVLSVLMQFPDAADECPQLCTDHFHIHAHRVIFDRLHKLRADNQTFELVSFVQDLLSAGVLDSVGGPSAVAELHSYQPTSVQLGDHVARLSQFRAFRAAIAACTRLENAALSHDPEMLSDALTAAQGGILDALTDGASAIPVGRIVAESLERFEKRVQGSDTSMGIPTIPELDQHLRGAHPGRLWVIGAYPEGGKSVIASQIIVDAAIAGTQALFLTLEMSECDLMDRMIVQASRVDARAYTEPKDYARENGNVNPAAGFIQDITNGVQRIKNAPLRLQRPTNRNLSTVVACIRKACREMDAKLVAVDYVQLIRGGKHDNKEGEISEISHALQEVAQDLGITLLVLSQLNQDGETKHGRVIEEDADAVLNIVQDRNKESATYKQHRHILIAKDRHYGSGGQRVPLILHRERIRFVPGEDTTQQAAPKFRR